MRVAGAGAGERTWAKAAMIGESSESKAKASTTGPIEPRVRGEDEDEVTGRCKPFGSGRGRPLGLCMGGREGAGRFCGVRGEGEAAGRDEEAAVVGGMK